MPDDLELNDNVIVAGPDGVIFKGVVVTILLKGGYVLCDVLRSDGGTSRVAVEFVSRLA